jgi:hypothetical protein
LTGKSTTVDFIARGASSDEWKMILVESGPWSGAIASHLRDLQERLYGCIDAALDGHLAEKFPESTGKDVVVQVDCHNLPKIEVSEFFERFTGGVFLVADYKNALAKSRFVRKFSFEITFDSIH